jgi:putative toxin-antitoxin system antitoxin component (TIGR02293 family)
MQTPPRKMQAPLDREVRAIFLKIKRKRNIAFDSSTVTYSSLLGNKMLITYLIREGVTHTLFHLIQASTPFSEKDWADLLDISLKSLTRYRQNETTFKLTQSEKIMEMAEVTELGLQVFGEMDRFKSWLDTPSFALGNVKPLELLRDSFGKELIVGELTRIRYGILA